MADLESSSGTGGTLFLGPGLGLGAILSFGPGLRVMLFFLGSFTLHSPLFVYY